MKYIHLPDLAFVRYCMEEYRINRGVYNTIDLCFFEKGYTEITSRRKNILSFLHYCHVLNITNQKGKIQFGNGGLAWHLQQYMKDQDIRRNEVS